MRRFNNRVARLAAFFALIAATATTVASVWHAGDDDVACIQVVVSSADGTAKAIGTAPPPAGDPRHCLLCHWTRWFRSIPSTRSQITAPSPSAIGFVVAVPVAARHQTHGLAPGRAPPA
jgi:hypothetical protein